MKKFLIKIIVLLFVKTRLILLLEKRILKYRRHLYLNKSILPMFKKRTILDHFIVSTLYFGEYYKNLKDQNVQRKLSLLTLNDGEGAYWAKYYYENQKGLIHRENRSTIYLETEKLIIDNNLDNSKVYFVNLGSSSGLDLLHFKKKFQNINFISSDINEEIINFQKENTFKGITNIDYIIGTLENVIEDIRLKFQNNSEIKIIFFTNATIQYVVPKFLDKAFNSLTNIKNKFYFCSSEQFRNTGKKDISFHVKNILWHHDYRKYIEQYDFKIKFYKIQNSGEDKINQNQNFVFSN
jgi:hypothetical protein